jgi:hypothetical protein
MRRRFRAAFSKASWTEPQLQQPPIPFQHTPLNDPNNHIRLIGTSAVRESPDPSTLPVLEIELFHTSLENARSYVAVSYAWGDPKPVHKLICNGSELYVPDNTFRALYTIYHATRRGSTALYTEGEPLTLWIDALCINQRDTQEKNCQVPLMGTIYQQAKGAIGYVGSPREGTDPNNAIVSMSWWANCPIIKPPDDLTTDRTNPRFQSWFQEARKRGVGDPPATITEDLTDLWSSDWFVRCWVTQEMVLPREVVCLYGYGPRLASWSLETLTILIERAQSVEHSHRDVYKIGKSFDVQLLENAMQVDAWRLMRSEIHKPDSKRDLIDLFQRSRRTKATDQRDIIYSLLGLMKDDERAAIRVDYSPNHSVTDVFLDVAKYCIPTLYGPRLLVEASMSRSILGLPS